jgi:polyisoprenyl-teichoic acid--peptidoglycan teichoic acid transferase
MATRQPSNSDQPDKQSKGNVEPSPKRPYQPPTPPRFFSPAEPASGSNAKKKGKTKAEKAAYPPKTKVSAESIPKKGDTRFVIGMVIAGIFALAVLVGLFVATRVFNLLGGITVERVDVNGNVISGSNIGNGSRVNVLLLGLDTRGVDNGDGIRSDTLIIVSIDQSKKTAAMLSIPRDLWVEIPGHGTNRINTSYLFGEQDKQNGGPPLAKLTVERNFGIPIHYFAQVDFAGFRQIIDAIGGITLDVKKPLIDAEFPTDDFGLKRIYIPAGIQRMNGRVALEYARSRHADSDFGRNQRQQEVLLAVREQGVNLGILTNTELQQALQGAIKTDLNTGEILSLAQLAIGMNRANIRTFSIDANYAERVNIAGNDVLRPDWTAIRQLLREFQDSLNNVAAPPAIAPTKAPAATVVPENAVISVLNGTFTDRLAARTQEHLQGKGFKINNVGQALDAGNYPKTIIMVYTGKNQIARELAKTLGLAESSIKEAKNGPSGIDIQVICGQDLKLPE